MIYCVIFNKFISFEFFTFEINKTINYYNMKKLILSVCFTTISCIASFAQAKKENIKVIYNTDFILDFDKIKSSIPAAYQASFKSEIDRGISVKFVLESNGKMSSLRRLIESSSKLPKVKLKILHFSCKITSICSL